MASQRAKCRWFRNYGVDVCWIIDPESRTVEVFEGARDGMIIEGILESVFLPGLRIPVESLFGGLVPQH
jgi:Uma2 family endonuclease